MDIGEQASCVTGTEKKKKRDEWLGRRRCEERKGWGNYCLIHADGGRLAKRERGNPETVGKLVKPRLDWGLA